MSIAYCRRFSKPEMAMAGNHEFAADTGAGGDFGGWIQESQGHDAEDGSGGAQLKL